jgi:lysylphosphatidylglycerol synthetase-like protein (DUF2156 family)
MEHVVPSLLSGTLASSPTHFWVVETLVPAVVTVVVTAAATVVVIAAVVVAVVVIVVVIIVVGGAHVLKWTWKEGDRSTVSIDAIHLGRIPSFARRARSGASRRNGPVDGPCDGPSDGPDEGTVVVTVLVTVVVIKTVAEFGVVVVATVVVVVATDEGSIKDSFAPSVLFVS